MSEGLPASSQPAPRFRKLYVDVPTGQLHCRVASPESPTRRPLMCLHMSPMSGRVYRRFQDQMGIDRLVCAPDTPGFGESDVPAVRPAIEDYADAVIALADGLGWDSIDVLGYHTGSMTALAVAERRPALVQHAVLFSAPVFTDEERGALRSHYRRPAVEDDGSHIQRMWDGHRRWSESSWGATDLAEQFADVLRNPQTSWWGHAAAFDHDFATAVQRSMVPTLVIDGDDDLHEHTLRALELRPDMLHRHLPGWSHGMLDLHSAELAGIVREFLS